MKSNIIENCSKTNFENTCQTIRNNIVSNGFILLHEINTQAILHAHGYTILPLRQILFFHPKYLHPLLQSDPLAINEIPIKIVVHERANGMVHMSCQDPLKSMSDYNCTIEIVEELAEKVKNIVFMI